MEYLDLTIAKESRRTESALCAISGKSFRKEAVLTALVPMKSVAQPVGSIKVDQKVGKKTVVENKNKSLAHKIQENTNEVSCCEKTESNNQGPTVDNADKVRKSSTVSFSGQTKSNALSPTSTTVNNTEKNEKDLSERTTSVGSKGSDKIASNQKQKTVCDGITNLP